MSDETTPFLDYYKSENTPTRSLSNTMVYSKDTRLLSSDTVASSTSLGMFADAMNVLKSFIGSNYLVIEGRIWLYVQIIYIIETYL
jgi:hypothetical protein